MQFIDYTKIDQKLVLIAGAIETNLLKFINPQNMEEQKKLFFEAIKKNDVYNPVFTYPQRNSLYTYFSKSSAISTFKTELEETIKEVGHDELGVIFESEIIDLLEKIEIIKSIGTENFCGNTESYFGEISKPTLRIAKETISQTINESEEIIPFSKATDTIKDFLAKRKLHYKIILRESAGSKFAVINSRKELLINKNTVFTKEMLKRLIAHEIETHVYRYQNGLTQPYKILAHGFSRETTETEEGLAVCVEKILGVSSKTQIKEYAGRLVAINEAMRKSFFDTFIELKKYFDDETAFRLTIRAKRGIKNQEDAGAFFKDALYFKGMLKVEDFLKEQKINELYYGKYSIEDIPLVKDLPGLRQPKYLPLMQSIKEQVPIS